MTLSRFAPSVTDSMEEQQWLTAIPGKTKSVTAWGIHVWNDWAAARAAVISETDRLIVTTPLLEIPVGDLEYWMRKFVLEARKMDGSEYPPKTLYSLVYCFKCYSRKTVFTMSTQLIQLILASVPFGRRSMPRCSEMSALTI